jgi:hypothetical protein
MHKASKLPVEMPEPAQYHGQSPMFEPDEIEDWYRNYLDAIGEPYEVANTSS